MTEASVAAFLARIDSVQARFAAHARRAPPSGLTEPDQPSGERWEWGQVWAHVAEFVPYWTMQIRGVLARPAAEDPRPFGRVKSDPDRVAAIARDRTEPVPELLAKLGTHLDDLRQLLRGATGIDWARTVRHSTLGLMSMTAVVDEFLVGHLEQHADQLDGLAGSAQGPHDG